MCYVEHEKCYREGIVQRDVSVNNIIVSNGEGHLIDFDHAKFTGKFKSVANGVMHAFFARQHWEIHLILNGLTIVHHPSHLQYPHTDHLHAEFWDPETA